MIISPVNAVAMSAWRLINISKENDGCTNYGKERVSYTMCIPETARRQKALEGWEHVSLPEW